MSFGPFWPVQWVPICLYYIIGSCLNNKNNNNTKPNKQRKKTLQIKKKLVPKLGVGHTFVFLTPKKTQED